MVINIGIDVSHNSLRVVKNVGGRGAGPISFILSHAFKTSSVSLFRSPETLNIDPSDTLFVNYLHGDDVAFPQCTHKSDSVTSVDFDGLEMPLSVAFLLYRVISRLKNDPPFRDNPIRAVVTHTPSFVDETNVTKSIIKRVLGHFDIDLKAIIPAVVSAVFTFPHQDNPIGTHLMCNISYSSTGVVAFNKDSFIPDSFQAISSFSGKTWDYDLYKYFTDHINERDVQRYAHFLTDRRAQFELFEHCKSARRVFFRAGEEEHVHVENFSGILPNIPALEITRTQFYTIILNSIQDFTSLISNALERVAQNRFGQVNDVYLTGEFCQIPEITAILEATFPQCRFTVYDVDSIKIGGALYCTLPDGQLNFHQGDYIENLRIHGVPMSVYPSLNNYLSNRESATSQSRQTLSRCSARFNALYRNAPVRNPDFELCSGGALIKLTKLFHDGFKVNPNLEDETLEAIFQASETVIPENFVIPRSPDPVRRLAEELRNTEDPNVVSELLGNVCRLLMGENVPMEFVQVLAPQFLGDVQQFCQDCRNIRQEFVQVLAQKFGLNHFSPYVLHSDQLDSMTLLLDSLCRHYEYVCETPEAVLVYFYYSKLFLINNDLIRFEWFLIELTKRNLTDDNSLFKLFLKMVEYLACCRFEKDLFYICPLFDVIKECSRIDSEFDPKKCFRWSFSTRKLLSKWNFVIHLHNSNVNGELGIHWVSHTFSAIKNDIYFALQRFIGDNKTATSSANLILHCIHAGKSWNLISEDDLNFLLLWSHYYQKTEVNGMNRILATLEHEYHVIPDDVHHRDDISTLIHLLQPKVSNLLSGVSLPQLYVYNPDDSAKIEDNLERTKTTGKERLWTIFKRLPSLLFGL
ncbi:hypothetical protein GEMRC1_000044 [Eukaryota sp. GEM-RC1]